MQAQDLTSGPLPFLYILVHHSHSFIHCVQEPAWAGGRKLEHVFYVIFPTLDKGGEQDEAECRVIVTCLQKHLPSVTSIRLITHLWEQMFSYVQDPLMVSNFAVSVTGKAGKVLYTQRDSTEEFFIFSLCLCVCVCFSACGCVSTCACLCVCTHMCVPVCVHMCVCTDKT